jgi:hypothetical protein
MNLQVSATIHARRDSPKKLEDDPYNDKEEFL